MSNVLYFMTVVDCRHKPSEVLSCYLELEAILSLVQLFHQRSSRQIVHDEVDLLCDRIINDLVQLDDVYVVDLRQNLHLLIDCRPDSTCCIIHLLLSDSATLNDLHGE